MTAGRLLFVSLLLFLGVAWLLWHQDDLESIWRNLTLHKTPLEKGMRATMAYELGENKSVNFTLPTGTKRIKLVVNAEVDLTVAKLPDTYFEYSFVYKVLGNDGGVLSSRVYHQRSKVTWFPPPKGNDQTAPITAGIMPSDTTVPTDTRVVYLDLNEYPLSKHPLRLRLQQQHAGDGIKNILVRIYREEVTPDRAVETLWKRLNEAERENIAEGNVYPYDFLTGQERNNLLKSIWKPLAPDGIEGQNYLRRKMYFRKEIEDFLMEGVVQTPVLYVGPGRRITLPVPEQGALWRLDLHPTSVPPETTHVINPSEISPEASTRITWYGVRNPHPVTHTLQWSKNGVSFTKNFKPGLLEIESRVPASLHVFDMSGEKPWEINIEALWMRTYSVSHEHVLRYHVTSLPDHPTPFRLDLRSHQSGVLECKFIDKSGHMLGQKTLSFGGPPSLYERPQDEFAEPAFSDPVQYYFRLPGGVAEIELRSASPVLATAYTRPADITKTTRIPEDLYSSPFKRDLERQTVWHILRPAAFRQLYGGERTQLLRIFPHPPEVDPAIAEGKYLWQELPPEGNNAGQYLLSPVEENTNMRKEGLSSIYTPLSVAERVATLAGSTPFRTVRPGLAFIREKSEPFRLTLEVDGVARYSRQLRGATGLLRLPKLKIGQRKIRIREPANTSVFMSNIAEASSLQGSMQLRFVYALPPQGLRFVFHKQSNDEERVNFKVFATSKEYAPSRLMLRIASKNDDLLSPSLTPSESYSLLQRRFLIRPDHNANSMTPYAEVLSYDAGRSFSIPLGPDLPPGEYLVNMLPEKDGNLYVQAFTLSPGAYNVRSIRIQED